MLKAELPEEEVTQVTGGRNWQKFGACVLSHGGQTDPSLATLGMHITTFNGAAVAVDISTGVISAHPIVKAALANS